MKTLKILVSLIMTLVLGYFIGGITGSMITIGSVNIAPFIFGLPLFTMSFLGILPRNSLFLGTYVDVDIPKPGKNAGLGGDKKDMIIVFNWDDVIGGYARDDKGILMPGDLIFKDGAYMSKIYATQNTIKAGDDSEGEIDAEGVTQAVDFSHPGDDVAIQEFKANWQSRNCGIIIQKCKTTRKKMYGSPCAPLRISWKGMDDDKSNTNVFTFKSAMPGPCIAEYQGTLTFSEVTGTVLADATNIDLTNGEGRYQLTDNAAATEIVTATNAVEGMVFTLLGSGGVNPATITNSDQFLVTDGTAWTGLSGSTITFKAHKYGPLATDWYFIEQSRS